MTIRVVLALLLFVVVTHAQDLPAELPTRSFTGTRVLVSHHPDSSQPPDARAEAVGVRRQGAIATARQVEDWTQPGRKGLHRIVFDLPNARFHGIEPFTRSLVTHSLAGHFESELTRSMQEVCRSSSALGAGEILGYRVVRLEQTIRLPKSPDERFVHEFWLAPELGCFPLRRTTTLYRAEQRVSSNTLVFTEITEAEPPAWMFEVPTDYNVIDYAKIPRWWRASAKP